VRFVVIVLCALIVFVLQVKLVPELKIAGATPELMLVMLVMVTLYLSPVPAVIIGFFLGFLLDLGNAHHLGANAMAYSIIAYGISHIGGGYLPEGILFKGLLVFVTSLFNDLIVLAIMTSFDIPDIFVQLFRHSLLSAIYTAVVGMIVITLLRPLMRRLVRSSVGI
jgi:rod shape-determining protein MreD